MGGPRVGMTGSPRISVILLAYNRKKYVRGAVASALHQTLPRERYEILVYKNFEDAELDEFLSANQVRNLTSEPTSRPRTLSTVLQDAQGELLAFLDDDDLFTPEKLAFVDRAFTEDRSLGYFHNGFVVIDDDGRPFERTPFPQVEQRVRIPAGDPRSRRLPPNALRLGFNTSSVSVRRDWLSPFLPSFDPPEAELSDAMLLGCALASGCGLLMDPTKLSHYRYHESWSNLLHYSLDSVGPIVAFDTVAIGALNLLAAAGAGTTLAPLVVDDLAYARFHRSLFADRSDWKPRVRDFATFLMGGLRQSNFAAVYIIPLYFVSRISPLAARKAYFQLAEGYRKYSYRSSEGT